MAQEKEISVINFQMDSQNMKICKTAAEVSKIIQVLKELSSGNLCDYETNLANAEELLKLALASQIVYEIKLYNPQDTSNSWKWLCLNLYLMCCLDNAFILDKKLERISVQEGKDIQNSIKTIVEIGLLGSLRPTLLANKLHKTQLFSQFDYKRLVGTVYGVSACFKSGLLKTLIITNCFKPILLSFYQILHSPLKKPNSESTDENSFVMTQEIYDDLIKDRITFRYIYKIFVSSVNPKFYIREVMLCLDKSCPNWLRKSLSNNLSLIIRGPMGIQNVLSAMLDAVGVDEVDDSTKSWSILLAIAKLIMQTPGCSHFKDNTYKQLVDLLKLRSKSGKAYKPFERLFALCAKFLYQQNRCLCEELFIKNILEPLMHFTNNNGESFKSEVDDSVEQSIRISYYLTVDDKFSIPTIPANILIPVLDVVFHLLLASRDAKLKEDIKNILGNLLTNVETSEKFGIFDAFLFNFPHEHILKIQKELEFSTDDNDRLIVKRQTYSVRTPILNRADAILEVTNNGTKLKIEFFSYLLNCLTNQDRYFIGDLSSANLLEFEQLPVLQEGIQHSIVVYKLLSDLASDQFLLADVIKNPELVTGYMKTVLQRYVDTNMHKAKETDSGGFQTMFLLLMLLQMFFGNSTVKKRIYDSFKETLQLIHHDCVNMELKELCKDILLKLKSTQTANSRTFQTAVEKALEDLSDPLLPVRGHALIALSKLIERRNRDALERRQYILTIFMQNLKNDDSFIYLSAIRGLTAMGAIYPDTILNTLTDEYVDFSRKDSEDGHEVRMKLGEALIRITKMLGAMTPKYKSLLLNTFLLVAKDEDHLMRASSLSNLGEVCKVLGYNLGTIVSEILVCVHAVISTDKSVEPRRAAVSVLCQLFVGLEKEMIIFLKDDILPIYRTLKNIYDNDKDDGMRLQAQLALEQLNENMKEFVFPNPQLHSEKKIIMLD